MGKHGAERSLTRVGVIAIVAAVTVGGVGAWAGAAALTGDSAEGTPGATSSSSAKDAAPQPDPSASSTATGDPAAALAACRQEVTDSDKVLAAVTSSAKNWRKHVEAQNRYEDGELTSAQSKKQWADSKAEGPKDLKRYDAAVLAAAKSDGGCEAAATSEGFADCTTRLKAVDAAVTKGGTVHKQWKAHLDMMAHHGDMDQQQYMTRWHGMVEDAATPLDEFDASAQKVKTAPACA